MHELPIDPLEEIGSGGLARVCKAVVNERVAETPVGKLARGDVVALKRLLPHRRDDEQCLRALEREHELRQELSPNEQVVVDSHAVLHHETEGVWLILELIEGADLRHLVDGRGLVVDLVTHIVRWILKGLRSLHEKGIAHCDLNAGNVIVTHAEERRHVRIIDLGSARRFGTTEEVPPHAAAFAAPELRRAGGVIDVAPTLDLYSLGIILHLLLSGELPGEGVGDTEIPGEEEPSTNEVGSSGLHAGGEQRSLRPRGERQLFLVAVARTLCAEDPRQRFQTASELLDILDEGVRSAWWREERLRHGGLQQLPPPLPAGQFAGRRGELSALHEIAAQVERGVGRRVSIRGATEMGKTWLLTRFLYDHVEAHPRSLVLYLDAKGEEELGLRSLALALQAGLGRADFRLRLERSTTLSANVLDDLLAALDGKRASLSQDVVQLAMSQLLEALASECQLVIAIDDAHRAAPDLLNTLWRLSESARALVLLAGEREFDDDRSITLEPLSDEDETLLVAGFTGSGDVARELQPHLRRLTGGNPTITRELLERLLQDGVLRRSAASPDSLELVLPAGGISLPEDRRLILRERLAKLGGLERRLLELASCSSMGVPLDVLAAVTGHDAVSVGLALAWLVQEGWLSASASGWYRPASDTVSDLLYDDTARDDHLRLGAAFCERLDSDRGERIAAACRQFLFGGDAAAARNLLPEALRFAEETGRHELQRDLLADFVEILSTSRDSDEERLTYLLLLAEACRGRAMELQLDSATRALRLAERLGDEPAQLRAGAAAASALEMQGEVPRALELIERMRQLAAKREDRASMARFTLFLGNLEDMRGLERREAARACYEETAVLARSCGDELTEAKARANLGRLALRDQQYDDAEREFRHCAEIASRHGEIQTQCVALLNLGRALHGAKRDQEAEEVLREARDFAGHHGLAARQASAFLWLGEIYWGWGSHAKVFACAHQAMNIARSLGRRQILQAALQTIAYSHKMYGNRERAVELWRECEEMARSRGDEREAVICMLRRGWVELQAGELDAAEAVLQHPGLCPETLDPRYHTELELRLVELVWRRGDYATMERMTRAAGPEQPTLLLWREVLGPVVELSSATRELVLGGLPDPGQVRMAIMYAFLAYLATADRSYLELARQRLDAFEREVPEEARAGVMEGIEIHRWIRM